MARKNIDYVRLNNELLQRVGSLLQRWLPNGFERAGRWYVGGFDGNAGESANVNMSTGQWIDNAFPDDDVGRDLISLYARVMNMANEEAALELMDELGWERPSNGDDGPLQAPAKRHLATPEPAAAADEVAPEPERKKKEKKWQAIVPVPSHAPKPGFVFGYKDVNQGGKWIEQTAVRTWEYRFDGQLFGYVARFERVSSKTGEIVKDTAARTWCQNMTDDRGLQGWHWKQWEAPRPLYVPRGELSADLRPVVVVEGEKCAEAGHVLLGDEFDFVSWPGGCAVWAMALWGWLIGRTVYLWPDCDAQRERLTKAERDAGVDKLSKAVLPEAKQPGMKAMVHIGSELLAKHRCQVFMIPIPAPGDVGEGWDIADAIAQGWGRDQVRGFIRKAVEFRSPNEAVRAAVGGASAGAAAGSDDGEDPSIAWRKYLLETEKGATKPVRENAVLALDGWPDRKIPGVPEAAGLIAFNEFTNNVVKTRPSPWGTAAGAWEEADELLMGEWLVREHYLPSMNRGTLEEAVLMVARRHSFHPVRERMVALRGKWDDEQRLKTWLERCCLRPDDPAFEDPLLRPYLERAGTWFLMGLVARVMPLKMNGHTILCGPGVKFDTMLILEGPQGWGKSTLSSVLGGEYFADTGLTIGEKDSLQNIQGILVYEWAELENMSRQEIGKVKAFISSPKDRFRASFDRRPRDYPRQVVFFGSTNDTHYLTDVSGNRRFWPVRVSMPPDQAWLRDNLDQLLAEAVQYVDAGERFWPNREEQKKLFDPQQSDRLVQTSLESAIRRYLYDPDQRTVYGEQKGTVVDNIGMIELLERIGYAIEKQTDVVVRRAGQILDAMGWTTRRPGSKDKNTSRPRIYVRPAEPAAAGRAASSSTPHAGPPEQRVPHDVPF
nr:VapE domain-containing protein [uncultured Roseateles sp.]